MLAHGHIHGQEKSSFGCTQNSCEDLCLNGICYEGECSCPDDGAGHVFKSQIVLAHGQNHEHEISSRKCRKVVCKLECHDKYGVGGDCDDQGDCVCDDDEDEDHVSKSQPGKLREWSEFTPSIIQVFIAYTFC